jgi:hypothetical protein
MEDFTLKNPNEIREELDTLSVLMADKLYTFRRLDEHKKITLAQQTIQIKISADCSISEAEKRALISNEYKTLIEGLVVAEKEYSISRSKYSNLQSWVDLYRSWIVTNRELSK